MEFRGKRVDRLTPAWIMEVAKIITKAITQAFTTFASFHSYHNRHRKEINLRVHSSIGPPQGSLFDKFLSSFSDRTTERAFPGDYCRSIFSPTMAGNMEIRDLSESTGERAPSKRILIVANRLPVTAERIGEESWSLKNSNGGLVSALLGLKDIEATWIGWAGINIADEPGRRTLTNALAAKRCKPVFLDAEVCHLYYNGFCNKILWPLLHFQSGVPETGSPMAQKTYQSEFDAYKKANKKFAEVVSEEYEDGDLIWCQDYHLILLPQLLKERDHNMKIGWFLHTPFPPAEFYHVLPSRSELLCAVLAADLVGFQTKDYACNFMSACTRILGAKASMDWVEYQGRLIRVAAFPIGIDSGRFISAVQAPHVQDQIKELKKSFSGRKVILGIDRLDMSKGIPHKLRAFEKFLEENAYWRDKVVLLQIAIPTRTEIPEYQNLSSQVHQIVSSINGRFSTFTSVPIHFLDRSIDFETLCALYAIADIALITSLRDGMNLVSFEFVTCQDAKIGVLILSEFAAAAKFLDAGAIIVNPYNITEVAMSISQALNMAAEEKEERYLRNYSHVITHTAQKWGDAFVSELNSVTVEAQEKDKSSVSAACPRRMETYLQMVTWILVFAVPFVLLWASSRMRQHSFG